MANANWELDAEAAILRLATANWSQKLNTRETKVGRCHSVLLGQAIRIAIRFGILKSLTQGSGQVQNSEISVARVQTGPKF